MKQFEYKKYRAVTFMDIESNLEYFGKQGWQLVSLVDKNLWLMREITKPEEKHNELGNMRWTNDGRLVSKTDNGEARNYNNTQSK